MSRSSSQPGEPDLRSQLQALLGSQQPRSHPSAAPPRRKAHPLYPARGGSGPAASSQRPGSAASQPGSSAAAAQSRRRTKSQPASPLSTGTVRGSQGSRSNTQLTARVWAQRRGAASAGSSPVKQEPPQQQHQQAHAPRQLDFSSQPLLASPEGHAASQQLRSPFLQLQPQQLQQLQELQGLPLPPRCTTGCEPPLDFARLRIVSPAASPGSSPSRLGLSQQQPAPAPASKAAGEIPSASQPFGASLSRWRQQHQQQQQQNQQQGSLESPAPTARTPGGSQAGSADWCVAPSPDIFCTQWQRDQPAQPAWQPTQFGGAAQEAAAEAEAAGEPAQPFPPLPAAAAAAPAGAGGGAGAGAPPSPFSSSQERRQEIAILCEMAADMGAWSSQEEEAAAQQGSQQGSQQYATPQQQGSQQYASPQQQGSQQYASPQQQGSQQYASPQQQGSQHSQHPSRPGMPAQQQPQGLGRRPSLGIGAAPPGSGAVAALSPAGWQAQSGGGNQCGGGASQQPFICSLSSQDISELADPWWTQLGGPAAAQQSQQQLLLQEPVGQQEQQAAGRQQHQHGEERLQGAAPADVEGMQIDGEEEQEQAAVGAGAGASAAAAAAAAAGPAPLHAGAPALAQRQYMQQGMRVDQQRAVGGPQARPCQGPGEQAQRGEEAEHQLEQEAAQDALVASTCPLPELQDVRESFAAQREAFAAADWYNRRMPRLQPPHIILSAVPQEELLPVGGGGGGGGVPPGQPQNSSASSGSGGDAAGVGPPGSRAQQEADSAATRQQQQGAAAAAGAGAPDFLSRFREGVLPAPASSGYRTAPLAPLLAKRQEEAAAAEARQRELEAANRAARLEYQAALRAMQEAASSAPATAPAPAPLMGQHQLQAAALAAVAQSEAGEQAGQAQPAAGAPPAAGMAAQGAAAAAAGGQGEEGWHQEVVRAFCVERRARSGTYYRSFTAASYPAVWALFRRIPCEERHWYEVVREGRPAHLYFDLEYDPRLNPQADGDALVDRLLFHVAEQLRRHFSLSLDPRCVYELDSSTPAKFSRHLTLRLPGRAFATNHAMGKFVVQVLAASGDELVVARGEQDGEVQRGSLVDMAVYSRNRHWRMSYCCKGGKAAVLLPTGRYATAEGATTSQAHIFLDTLVCNVDPRARLLQMPDPLPANIGVGRGGGGGGSGGLQTSAAVVEGNGRRHVAWKRDAGDASLPLDQMEELQRLAEAALPFIERVATQRAGGAPARARTLAFCGAGATVAYSMIGPGSHYCENMGRPHTSNHVFFVADFVRGAYAQKCHDPDCSRFRSGWMPLPPMLCLPEAAAAALGLGPPPSPPATSSRRSGQISGPL